MYTHLDSNGYKEVSLDESKDDLRHEIEELTQRIAEFKQELVKEKVEKHLKLMVKDGLIDENFAPVGFPKPFGGK